MVLLTRCIDGMRARGYVRGDGEGSRLCEALREGDAVTDIMMFDTDQEQFACLKRCRFRVEIRSISESSSVYGTLTASLCSPGVVF